MPTSIVARCSNARKGTLEMLPRAKKVSSAARVSDGMLQSNSEGSLHYCLLLSGGDTNNRGEDDEGFNTPVCSLCICWQRSIISQYRTCAKTDFLDWAARLVVRRLFCMQEIGVRFPGGPLVQPLQVETFTEAVSPIRVASTSC